MTYILLTSSKNQTYEFRIPNIYNYFFNIFLAQIFLQLALSPGLGHKEAIGTLDYTIPSIQKEWQKSGRNDKNPEGMTVIRKEWQ